MPFTVFIGGLLEYNSGKTTFAKEMISVFEQDYSMKTVPFKPLSGNNLFYHYEKIRESVEKFGNFVSLDIMTLMEHSSSDVPITLTNPVHKVNTQAFSYGFYKESSLNTFFSRFSDSVSLFQRFTLYHTESNITSCFIVNEPVYTNQKFWNDHSLTEPILKNTKELKYYKDDYEFYSLNSQYYAEATQKAFEHIQNKSELIVIESFNNSAHPAWCIRESNAIFLVGPGSLFSYEPEAYFRAIDNYRAINRNKPTTTDEVLKIATPLEALSLSVDEEKRKEEIRALVKKLVKKIK